MVRVGEIMKCFQVLMFFWGEGVHIKWPKKACIHCECMTEMVYRTRRAAARIRNIFYTKSGRVHIAREVCNHPVFSLLWHDIYQDCYLPAFKRDPSRNLLNGHGIIVKMFQFCNVSSF